IAAALQQFVESCGRSENLRLKSISRKFEIQPTCDLEEGAMVGMPSQYIRIVLGVFQMLVTESVQGCLPLFRDSRIQERSRVVVADDDAMVGESQVAQIR